MNILAILLLSMSQIPQADMVNQASYWESQSIESVQAAARHGDKHAQFELGGRYQRGLGVQRNLALAEKWYRRAARTTVTPNYVYSGPVGSEKHGRAVEVGHPKTDVGLPAAAIRLEAVRRLRKGWRQ